jgi:hypothetical protein
VEHESGAGDGDDRHDEEIHEESFLSPGVTVGAVTPDVFSNIYLNPKTCNIFLETFCRY